jgi:hypothetical protein
MEIKQIITHIYELDMAFGNICYEAEECYERENYMATLACIFIIAEQSLKFRLDKTDGNFHNLINDAYKKGKINKNDFSILMELKKARNTLFHENHYSNAVIENSKANLMSEDDTKKMLCDRFFDYVFGFVLDTLSENRI